jgi:hypothetical protein
VVDKPRAEADSFDGNAERMRYPEFRRQHLVVGSRVIEAGSKTVIGDYSTGRSQHLRLSPYSIACPKMPTSSSF